MRRSIGSAPSIQHQPRSNVRSGCCPAHRHRTHIRCASFSHHLEHEGRGASAPVTLAMTRLHALDEHLTPLGGITRPPSTSAPAPMHQADPRRCRRCPARWHDTAIIGWKHRQQSSIATAAPEDRRRSRRTLDARRLAAHDWCRKQAADEQPLEASHADLSAFEQEPILARKPGIPGLAPRPRPAFTHKKTPSPPGHAEREFRYR